MLYTSPAAASGPGFHRGWCAHISSEWGQSNRRSVPEQICTAASGLTRRVDVDVRPEDVDEERLFCWVGNVLQEARKSCQANCRVRQQGSLPLQCYHTAPLSPSTGDVRCRTRPHLGWTIDMERATRLEAKCSPALDSKAELASQANRAWYISGEGPLRALSFVEPALP